MANVNKGISAHLIFNGLSVFLPLVLIPILVRRLGVSEYGVLALIQALVSGITTIADFGYGSIGQKIIASRTSRVEKMKTILQMWFIHVVLWLIGCVTVLLYLYFSSFDEYSICFGLAALTVFFVYCPPGYISIYMGEQLHYSLTWGAVRLAHTIAVVAMLDINNWQWSYFGTLALFSMLGALSILQRFMSVSEISFASLRVREDFYPVLVEGGVHFLRRLATLIPSIGIPAYLGASGGKVDIAAYAIADKLRILIWQLLSPVFLGYSPNIFTASSHGQSKLFSTLIRKVFGLTMIVCIGVSVSAFMLSDYIVQFVVGNIDDLVLKTWRVASLAVIFSGFSGFFSMIIFPFIMFGGRSAIVMLTVSTVCFGAYIYFGFSDACSAQYLLITVDIIIIIWGGFMYTTKYRNRLIF